MKRRFILRVVAALVLAALCFSGKLPASHSSAQTAAQSYTITDLGTIDPTNYRTLALAVNRSGQVVGSTSAGDPNNPYRGTAFLWQNGVMTDIGTMTGSRFGSTATDINDGGQIVGYGDVPDSNYLHAIWWHDDTWTDLHSIVIQSGLFSSLGAAENTQSSSIRINNTGQILGVVQGSNNTACGFIYSNGTVTRIDLPSDITEPPITCCPPQFLGLNNLGQVVGYFALNGGSVAHTFVWDSGTTTILSQPEGWPTSNGSYINDAGQIVGRLYNGVDSFHGFLFENGTMQDIGNIQPLAINNSGQIVGSTFDAMPRAFIYRDGTMTELNDFVPAGYTLNDARDINEAGQIVAHGEVSGSSNRHAFLLTPLVPTYTIGLQYDPAKAHRLGSTIPIKIQVLDLNGNNVSDPSLIVRAVGISVASNNAPGQIAEDSGNANPDNDFRFDAGLTGYIYNLSTRNLAANTTYKLYFQVGSDPYTYSVEFQVK